MSVPYLCPNCGSNRSKFNIIEQVVRPVKLNPQSGEVVEEYSGAVTDPFHVPYKGPAYKVQCGVCGLLEDEILFIKRAQQGMNK